MNVTECPKNLEERIKRIRAHWKRGNLDAAATTARIYRVRDRLFDNVRAVMEQYGLNPGEFEALASLRKYGPPYEGTPSFICQANLVSSGGLTKVLNSLEKRGYITRVQSSEDRRSTVVKLTRKGRQVAEDALAEAWGLLEKTLSGALTKKERDELDRLLIKLNGGAP